MARKKTKQLATDTAPAEDAAATEGADAIEGPGDEGRDEESAEEVPSELDHDGVLTDTTLEATPEIEAPPTTLEATPEIEAPPTTLEATPEPTPEIEAPQPEPEIEARRDQRCTLRGNHISGCDCTGSARAPF